VGAGITYGGDTLATVRFRNGDTYDLHGGSLAEVYAGVDYRLAEQWSIEATLGYHADFRDGRNGHPTFERFPVALPGHFHLTPNWRFGGGVRYAINPRLSGGGVLSGQGVAYRADLGAVLEGEYLLFGRGWRDVGFKLRGVTERYKVRDDSASGLGGTSY